MWEWLGPGGLPGLQNLWRVALRAAVGSTPIHSRLLKWVGATRHGSDAAIDYADALHDIRKDESPLVKIC
jgi:hypothetical protein